METFPTLKLGEDALVWLSNNTISENWGDNYTYLRYYCDQNFAIARDQHLLYQDPQGRYLVWRIGHLVHQNGAPLHAFCIKDRYQDGAWYCPVVLQQQGTQVKVLWKSPEDGGQSHEWIKAPSSPKYDIFPYREDYTIEVNWPHILDTERNRGRLEEILPEELTGMMRYRRLVYHAVSSAIYEAHKRANYRGDAVPQYYDGEYQYLLPLYITHENYEEAPDIVAALQADNSGGALYTIKTLLPPKMAYSNARCVAKTQNDLRSFRHWIRG